MKEEIALIWISIVPHHGIGCECTTSSTDVTIVKQGLHSHGEVVLTGLSHSIHAAVYRPGEMMTMIARRQQDFS